MAYRFISNSNGTRSFVRSETVKRWQLEAQQAEEARKKPDAVTLAHRRERATRERKARARAREKIRLREEYEMRLLAREKSQEPVVK